MKLSHSKLSTILNCPMTYYLSYIQDIQPITKVPAFQIGSAVHWGLEHDTCDLETYYKEVDGIDRAHYKDENVLSEEMDRAYLRRKQRIYDAILGDSKLINEEHELYISAPLKSYKFNTPHMFEGIIDLLFLTDKGFIIIDYKTSTMMPNWDDYLDQIYRYIFLLKSNFPDTPIYKIGIINIRKSGLRRKYGESIDSFANRLELDYEASSDMINLHLFDTEQLDNRKIDEYLDNLSKAADLAQTIDENQVWWINFAAANGKYKSPYLDIFNQSKSAWVFYSIKDTIFDEEQNKIVDRRPCVDIDMQVIHSEKKILNKYEQFKANAFAYYTMTQDINKQKLFEYLRSNFVTNNELLEKYWITLEKEVNNFN